MYEMQFFQLFACSHLPTMQLYYVHLMYVLSLMSCKFSLHTYECCVYDYVCLHVVLLGKTRGSSSSVDEESMEKGGSMRSAK